MTEGHRTRAAVVFATRFGTTEKVARSLERGLQEANLQTVCADSQSLLPESLKDIDLLCVGGPTEIFSATKPIKEFLRSIRGFGFGGKFGFAFDTKYDSRVSGSAAKYIEHALDDGGVRLVAGRESAIVSSRKEGGRIVGAVLKDGEERRFEELGRSLGLATTKALGVASGTDWQQR